MNYVISFSHFSSHLMGKRFCLANPIYKWRMKWNSVGYTNERIIKRKDIHLSSLNCNKLVKIWYIHFDIHHRNVYLNICIIYMICIRVMCAWLIYSDSLLADYVLPGLARPSLDGSSQRNQQIVIAAGVWLKLCP